ncbi:MAG: response regulator, partial [Gemmatimonadetes bacterium]|nr:response regulator [Gemmatimonadota bacterium]
MTCRILVVEDSPTQAAALGMLLEQAGNEVVIARSAESALEQLAAAPFDVVLTDIVMPGMNGYDLCRRIKGDPESRDIPVVLLTSLSDPMDIVQGLECGADNYITKPYDPDHLLARVRHVLDNRRLRLNAKTSLGVNVRFLGKDLAITSEKEQILDLFISSVEDVVRMNAALLQSQRALADAHARLEAFAQEKAHEARVSDARYRALLHNAGDAVIVLDSDGRIVEANPRATELLTRSANELSRQKLVDLLPAAGLEELRAGLLRL